MSESNVGKTLTELRVSQLRGELEKRKLSTSGIKVILSDRLERAIKQEGHNPLTFRFFEDSEAPSGVSESSTEAPPPTTAASINTPSSAVAESATTEVAAVKEENIVPAATVAPKTEAPAETPINIVEKQPAPAPLETPTPAPPAPAPTPVANTSAPPASSKSEPIDLEKERELAPRSLWVKGLRAGTKAAEIKALFTPIGPVTRAKIFTVKKSGSESGGCLGYVTMSNEPEAEMAIIKLHKTSFKGAIVTVTKATVENIPFAKKKEAKKEEAAAPAPPAISAPVVSPKAKESVAKKSDKDTKEKSKESVKRASTPRKERPREPERKRTTAPYSSGRPTNTYYKGTNRRVMDNRRPIVPDYRLKNRMTSSLPRGATRGYRSMRGGTVYNPRMSNVGHNAVAAAASRDQRAATAHNTDMMYRFMSIKETEHRQREEELRLEKERQRIRAEKERIEKEKLQLQLAALQQQQQQAKQEIRTSVGGSNSRGSFNAPAAPTSRTSYRESRTAVRRKEEPRRESKRERTSGGRRRDDDIKRRRSRSPQGGSVQQQQQQAPFKGSLSSRVSGYPSAYNPREYDTGRAAVAGSSWLTGGREGGSSGSFNAGYGVTPTSAWNIGYAPMDQQYRRY